MHDKHFITINKYAIMSNMYACVCWFHLYFTLYILSRLINCHPHQSIYHISMLHKIHDQYNNDYFRTSPKGKSYPVPFGTHTQGQDQPRVFRDKNPRAAPTPYTHIGVSSSRALGTFTQGPTIPHK